jgi:hypothetical protein
MSQTIGIDWDHTCWDNLNNRPMPGVHEAFDKIKMAGHKILIHSCNSPSHIRKLCEENNLRPTWIWGEEKGFEGTKPVCAAYIDDRAFHFDGDWSKVDDVLLFVSGRPIK